MKKWFSAFGFPLRLLAFWLLFFAVYRLWFVLWFFKKWSAPAGGRIWESFFRALPLDLSTAAYAMAIPLILWYLGLLGGEKGLLRRVARWGIFGANLVAIAAGIIIFTSNIFLYEEWHTQVNIRAVEYLGCPSALVESVSVVFSIIAPFLVGAVIWFWLWVERRIVGKNLWPEAISRWNTLWLPPQMGLLFFFLRGGLAVMPINESAVFYSTHMLDNHAATNTAWHFIHSVVESRARHNPFIFREKDAARASRDSLFASLPDTSARVKILNPALPRPNIVFVMMESHTAQVIEELGGEPGVCPNLSRMMREGILFENIYGSGYRTEQGVVSLLSGTPAQPDQSVILLEDKAVNLPSVSQILKKQGYATAFYYGGGLTFGNLNVFLREHDFDKVLSDQDFPAEMQTQRWGVDDRQFLDRAADEIADLPQPFFSMVMTLSLHPPFDVPFKSRWSESLDDRDKFLNSAAFADDALGKFFDKAKSLGWFQNSLFVVVADHGVSLPGRVDMSDPRSRHIPMLVFGGALAENWRGKRVLNFGNHHDIPATVLAQLGLPAGQFTWSRDLLAEKQANSFAYYSNENGLGWVVPEGAGLLNFQSREWTGKVPAGKRRQAEGYLQSWYEEFLGL